MSDRLSRENPDRVVRENMRIRVDGRLTQRTALWVLARIREVTSAGGQDELILDFERCTRAWPDGMCTLVCEVARLRGAGYEFDLIIPRDETLQRLFMNANWAHFIAPGRYEPFDMRTPFHLPATWYDAGSHKEIVDQIVEIVMGSMEIERPVLAGLEWSVNEITDNVLNHAESPRGGLVQVVTQRENRRIQFVVADGGRGVLASMRDGFPHLRDDAEAIGEAVKQGVTRNPEIGQGNGLAGTLRIAALSNGSFSILSGQAFFSVYPNAATGEHGDHMSRLAQPERFDGTVVTADFDSSAPLRLQEALGFKDDWEPFDMIDAAYLSSDGQRLTIQLRNETAGFGSRIAGEQVRAKCLNLLRGEPSIPLILDWAGVPLVSSSFADEAIGKLFLELGPLAFGSRLHNVNMEPLVRSLIERAILQRMAHQQQGGL
ncbi:MAG: STAS-like domain-containing protein [Gaiellaceae bacterium]